MRGLFLCLIGFLLCISAEAQLHPAKRHESNEIHIIGSEVRDTLQVYKAFTENAPKLFHIPSAPRFAIVGKDEKFYLGIGGSGTVTIAFDFPNPITDPSFFSPSNIPMGNLKGNGGLLQINGQESNVFMNVIALPESKYRLGFYFGFNLCNNYAPNVTQAYLTFLDFLAGYNTSLYYDGNACPPTVDLEGPNSSTWALNMVVDYIHSFPNGLSVAAGAEIGPESFTTVAGESSAVSQRIPDVPVYIQYQSLGCASYVRLSAILRNMQYRDLISGRNRNVGGWGIKMSGVAQYSEKLIFYYQAAYGVGVTSYLEDTEGLGLDLVPDSEHRGRLIPVKAWGAYVGIQYNWNSKWFSSLTYSHLRNYARRYQESANSWEMQYKYGQYLAANLFYNINSQMSWAIEWDWGRTVDFNRMSRHDNRLQTMFQINF